MEEHQTDAVRADCSVTPNRNPVACHRDRSSRMVLPTALCLESYVFCVETSPVEAPHQ